jgi:uncharacterized protein (DUF2147 family)
MKQIAPFALAATFAAALFAPTPALADPSGVWLRENGNARVRMARCGDSFCGTIAWVKDPDSPSKVGQRVFYEMKESGANAYSGKAFNPENGKTYSGKMTISGGKMTTSGCVLGGMICQSVNWTKVN